MLIDFSEVIKNEIGEPYEIIEPDEANLPVKKGFMTLAYVSRRTLNYLYEDEKNLLLEESLKRGNLAIKIGETKEPLQLSHEECALLQRLISKYPWSKVVIVRAHGLLEEGKK